MELEYNVHSCQGVMVEIMVIALGRDVVAAIPGLVVELVETSAVADPHGHTFRFVPGPDEMEDAVKTFAVGNRVRVTFEHVGDAR